MPRPRRTSQKTSRKKRQSRRKMSIRRRSGKSMYRSALANFINGPGPLHVSMDEKATDPKKKQSQLFIAPYAIFILNKSLQLTNIETVVRAFTTEFSVTLSCNFFDDVSYDQFSFMEPSILLAKCVGTTRNDSSDDPLRVMTQQLCTDLLAACESSPLFKCACNIGLDLLLNGQRLDLTYGWLPAYAIVLCLMATMKRIFDMISSVNQHVNYILERLKMELKSTTLVLECDDMDTCQMWDIALENVVKRSWKDYRMKPKVATPEETFIANGTVVKPKEKFIVGGKDSKQNLAVLISICIHREAVLRAAWDCVLYSLFELPHNKNLSDITKTNLMACLVPYMDPHEMPRYDADLSKFPPLERCAIKWWRYQYPDEEGKYDVDGINTTVQQFRTEVFKTTQDTLLKDENWKETVRVRQSKKEDQSPPKQKDEQYDEECVVCMEKTDRIKFLPCGHQVVCVECDREMSTRNPHYTCPMCRTTITYKSPSPQ